MSQNKHLCLCGSGKRTKVCCGRPSRGSEPLSSKLKLEMRQNAEALAEAGRDLDAAAILEELASRSPGNPLIWNDLGVQYEAAGEIERAMAALRRGYAADSSYPPTLFNLGKFTLDRYRHLKAREEQDASTLAEMLVEAIGFLNANLDRDPENADCHYWMALACALHGDELLAEAHRVVAARLRQGAKALPVGRRDAPRSLR